MGAMSASAAGAEWERLFWLVFERSSNPIVLLDDRRHIVKLNEAAQALFGGDASTLIGTSMAASIRPAERRASASEWEEFLSGGGEYTGRRSLLRADGSEVQMDFAARLAMLGERRMAIYVAVPTNGRTPARSAKATGELPLTSREREIVTLIALGQDSAEIARMLHISPETVRTHVRNAMSKLGAHTRAQLVAITLCSGEHLHAAQLE